MLAELENLDEWIIFFIVVFIFVGFSVYIQRFKDVVKDQPKSKGFRKPSSWPCVNVPKINLPKFKDSGWVLFYVICGCICFVLMFVFFFQDNSTFAFMMLGCSLSCFFAAHVLRLQEKVAFHAEQQTDHAERQTIHAEKQTELLEKISKPSVQPPPIIEDKEK